MRKLTEQEEIKMLETLAVAKSRLVDKYKTRYDWFKAGFNAALEMQDERLQDRLTELLNGLKVGDKVALRHNPALGTATIVSTISDVRGGVVLDKNLDHFKCWNVEDLEKVEK